MIKIKHPIESCNREQEELLSKCPASLKKFHELSFNYGNAAYRYHTRAKLFNPTIVDYQEWLSGLPANIKTAMEEKGFDYCQTTLPFTRYVNEKNDIGMDEFMRKLMGDALYTECKNMANEV